MNPEPQQNENLCDSIETNKLIWNNIKVSEDSITVAASLWKHFF